MKFLLGLLLLTCLGCLHGQEVDIPSENIYFILNVRGAYGFASMPKGFLNEENKGELWWSLEDSEEQGDQEHVLSSESK